MTNLNYYNIFICISALSVIIPIFFVVKTGYSFNLVSKTLFLYLVCSFFTEVINYTLSENNYTSAIPLITNIFSVVELLCISFIYWNELNVKKTKKTFLNPILIIACLFVFTITLVFSLTHLFTCFIFLVIISLALFYFFKIFSNLDSPILLNHYFFWMNCAFLFYFSTSFFLFLFEEFIVVNNNSIGRLLWSIQLVANIIYYIILSVGICKMKSK